MMRKPVHRARTPRQDRPLILSLPSRFHAHQATARKQTGHTDAADCFPFLDLFSSFFLFFFCILPTFFSPFHISGPRSTALHPGGSTRRRKIHTHTHTRHAGFAQLGVHLGFGQRTSLTCVRHGWEREAMHWSALAMLGYGRATWIHDSDDLDFGLLFFLFFNVKALFSLTTHDYEGLGFTIQCELAMMTEAVTAGQYNDVVRSTTNQNNYIIPATLTCN